MFRNQRIMIYGIIFTIILGVTIFGALNASEAAKEQPVSPGLDGVHKITRVLRNTDEYFEGMSDREIVQTGQVVCAVLRQGSESGKSFKTCSASLRGPLVS